MISRPSFGLNSMEFALVMVWRSHGGSAIRAKMLGSLSRSLPGIIRRADVIDATHVGIRMVVQGVDAIFELDITPHGGHCQPPLGHVVPSLDGEFGGGSKNELRQLIERRFREQRRPVEIRRIPSRVVLRVVLGGSTGIAFHGQDLASQDPVQVTHTLEIDLPNGRGERQNDVLGCPDILCLFVQLAPCPTWRTRHGGARRSIRLHATGLVSLQCCLFYRQLRRA